MIGRLAAVGLLCAAVSSRLAAVAGDGSCAASCATKPGSLGELLECEFFSAHSTEQILSLSESELFVALGEYGVGVFERKALVPQVKTALKAAGDKTPPPEPPPTPKKDDKPRPAAVLDDDLDSMSYQQLMKLAYAQHDTKLVEAALMSQPGASPKKALMKLLRSPASYKAETEEKMAVDAKAEEQRMAVQKAEEAKKKKEQEEYQAAKKAEKAERKAARDAKKKANKASSPAGGDPLGYAALHENYEADPEAAALEFRTRLVPLLRAHYSWVDTSGKTGGVFVQPFERGFVVLLVAKGNQLDPQVVDTQESDLSIYPLPDGLEYLSSAQYQGIVNGEVRDQDHPGGRSNNIPEGDGWVQWKRNDLDKAFFLFTDSLDVDADKGAEGNVHGRPGYIGADEAQGDVIRYRSAFGMRKHLPDNYFGGLVVGFSSDIEKLPPPEDTPALGDGEIILDE